VLLVFQYGQPRIFFAMARDGLLPQWAARVDQRTRIPYMTTLVTGVLVAVASLVGDAAETYDLTNIGTLFAFALVCAGVLVLRVKEPDRPRPFRVPGYPWTPLLFVIAAAALVANTIFTQPGRAAVGIGVVLLGLPVYFIWQKRVA